MAVSDKFGSRYEITAFLGKGGMGEVYRARDKRLRRNVALKVLPEAWAHDPERVALFQREAQLIAALNHPNIGVIHELEENAGTRWLVLELVDGETLEERLRRGPIPVPEALSIARQICDGLEAAHDKGIIHRDLKPANIKITPDEKVKLLDFGLASVFETNPRTTDLANSPTLHTPSSVPEHAGTAAYMSPEQFQWKTINKQVDVWAFGCVLFEMLTGKYAFPAETLRETATLILETEPDWSLLGSASPVLVKLIQRCLEKDRRKRLHDIADARVEIDAAANVKAVEAVKPLPAGKKSARQWVLASLFFAVGMLAAFFLWKPTNESAVFPPVHFSIPVAQTNSITQVSVSPDGRQIAYVAGNNGDVRKIWIRSIDGTTSRVLEGTEEPGGLFWAPDSQRIAFLGHNQLGIVDIRDGRVRTMADAPGATSGSWSPSGEILIDSSEGGGLFRLSSNGGNSSRATSPDPSHAERHYQPQFLPDGEHYLFLVRTNEPQKSGIYIGSLNSRARVFLTQSSSKAIFSAPSQLFFVRNGTLLRQGFEMDTPRLVGDPVRIAEHVSVSAISGSAAFSVSPNGVLAYRSGSDFQNGTLQWFDRNGKQAETTSEPAVYTQATLSPDEKYIAAERRDPDSGSYDIWVLNLARNMSTRLTSDIASDRDPVWLPDSRHVVFSSDESGRSLFETDIDSVGKVEPLLNTGEAYRPLAVTRDNVLLLRDYHGAFFTLPLRGERKLDTVLKNRFQKADAAVSPQGNLLAYTSDDSGRNEIYLAPFPKADSRKKISEDGGIQPIWNASGTELFYLDAQGRIMAVSVQFQHELTVGFPKLLFSTGMTPSAGLSQYAVNGKGTRFLAIVPVRAKASSPIDVIVNWSAAR